MVVREKKVYFSVIFIIKGKWIRFFLCFLKKMKNVYRIILFIGGKLKSSCFYWFGVNKWFLMKNYG